MSLRQADSGSWTADRVEECKDCERETPHEVSIELRSENPESAFSREPYRVAECQNCGCETTRRMNNA